MASGSPSSTRWARSLGAAVTWRASPEGAGEGAASVEHSLFSGAIVTRDTGKLLTVRVSVARGSRNGTFTLTITLANGHTTKVRYNQHG